MVSEWFFKIYFEWYFLFFLPFSGIAGYFKLPLSVPVQCCQPWRVSFPGGFRERAGKKRLENRTLNGGFWGHFNLTIVKICYCFFAGKMYIQQI